MLQTLYICSHYQNQEQIVDTLNNLMVIIILHTDNKSNIKHPVKIGICIGL